MRKGILMVLLLLFMAVPTATARDTGQALPGLHTDHMATNADIDVLGATANDNAREDNNRFIETLQPLAIGVFGQRVAIELLLEHQNQCNNAGCTLEEDVANSARIVFEMGLQLAQAFIHEKVVPNCNQNPEMCFGFLDNNRFSEADASNPTGYEVVICPMKQDTGIFLGYRLGDERGTAETVATTIITRAISSTA